MRLFRNPQGLLLVAIMLVVLWVIVPSNLMAILLSFVWSHLGMTLIFVGEAAFLVWLLRIRPMAAAIVLLASAFATFLLIVGGGPVVLPLRSGKLAFDCVLAPLLAIGFCFSVGPMFGVVRETNKFVTGKNAGQGKQ